MSEQQGDETRDSSDSTERAEAGAPGEITDDQLPEDLQPSEDNPLARHPEQTGDEEDRIGADREEAPETAPLTASDADYGSGGESDGPDAGRVKAEEDDGSESLDNGGGGNG